MILAVENRYKHLVEEVKNGFDRCDTLLCQLISREAPKPALLPAPAAQQKEKGVN